MGDDARLLPVMTEHASCMGEFYPRLWVGNLKSVGYLSQLAANDNTDAAATPLTTTPIWTVISILESDILFQWARQRCAVDTSIIRRHVDWKLADSSTAEFLSSKLNSILLEIDAALNGTTVADLCEEKNRFHSNERDGENDCRKCSLDEGHWNGYVTAFSRSLFGALCSRLLSISGGVCRVVAYPTTSHDGRPSPDDTPCGAPHRPSQPGVCRWIAST
jgi:hypothetical protein